MKINSLKALLVTLPLLLAISTSAHAADGYEAPVKKDNTGINVRDNGKNRTTADQQTLVNDDLQVIAAIRREIVANDELSTYGENVKIVRENGKVVLRGPVPNLEEKNWIGQAAKKAAPNIAVVNELDIVARK